MVKTFLRYKYIILVLVLSTFSVRALFHSGLPPTHDGEYHVIRFYEFHKVLSEGTIYPRWAADLNNGMGAPLFNYVYPLPNYFSSFTHSFGFSFIDSFKLNLIFATIVGSIFMFLFSRIFFGNIGGLVSSVYYTYVPYRFLDIFIRGSVGEVWALAFFPAFLWAITKLFFEKNKVYISISGFFLALVVFSHNILALMFFVFSAVYVCLMALSTGDKKFTASAIVSMLLGLGLSSIFWVPALLEKRYVRGLDIFNFKENFPDIYQLIIPSWGSGFSGGAITNQMSFQIGIGNLFVILLSTILVIRLRKKLRREIFFFLVSFFVVFFLMTRNSIILWDNIPLLSYFQFPWRLLSLEMFIVSFLAGFVVAEVTKAKIFSRKLKSLILAFILLIPVLTTLSYARPAFYHEREDNHYITRPNFISGTNSPGDVFNTIWAKDTIHQRKSFEFEKGVGEIKISKKSSTSYDLKIETGGEAIVRSSLMYFPGWVLSVDGREEKIFPDKNGQIKFVVVGGEHMANLRLNRTNIQSTASLVSIISALVLVLFLVRNYTIIRK